MSSANILVTFLTGTSIFVLLTVILYALRLWIKGTRFGEKVNGRGMVAIVTGANSGIGKQLCRELAMRHVKVYMFCRNVDRAAAARSDLVKQVFFLVILKIEHPKRKKK
jgi:hypothetical protein